MDYNQAFKNLLGIGLDDYPSSDYSPIEAYYPLFHKHPQFISKKSLQSPLFGLFTQVEVVTFDNLYNRVMTLMAPDFLPDQMHHLQQLVRGLVDIYGGDKKGMLWLLDEEIEEILNANWKGREWDFSRYEEVHDILLYLSPDRGLMLIIREKGNLLDFPED